MHALRRGCVGFLALSVIAACADKDPLTRNIASSDVAFQSSETGGRQDGNDGRRQIAIVDDCDPTDPGWAPSGGCALPQGDVRLAEFNALLVSPLSAAVVGHPAWRMQPSYLESREDKDIRITNVGGRLHTFTPVAQFGGGRVPPLNFGMTPAPECALAPGATDPLALPPGNSLSFNDLTPGIHRYQCCIHPWMRALIRITDHEHDHDM